MDEDESNTRCPLQFSYAHERIMKKLAFSPSGLAAWVVVWAALGSLWLFLGVFSPVHGGAFGAVGFENACLLVFWGSSVHLLGSRSLAVWSASCPLGWPSGAFGCVFSVSRSEARAGFDISCLHHHSCQWASSKHVALHCANL